MSRESELSHSISIGPTSEFLRSLWRLDHALQRLSKRMEVSHGVTAQQRMMIRCIGRFPGVTAGQLAGHFHLDAGTVSTALSRLERKGLLKRRRDPRDRRRVTLGLTEAGRAIDVATLGTVEHAVRTLLGEASTDEVTCTVRMLGRLTALLDAESSSPEAGYPREPGSHSESLPSR
jgi:MarR family transcriptional regulator, organic hydroperoxide resistance regulator